MAEEIFLRERRELVESGPVDAHGVQGGIPGIAEEGKQDRPAVRRHGREGRRAPRNVGQLS